MATLINAFTKLNLGETTYSQEFSTKEEAALSSQFKTLSNRDISDLLSPLNDNLRNKTFVTGSSINTIDFILFSKLHSQQIDPSIHRHILRWLDLLQTSYINVDSKIEINYIDLPKEVKEKKKKEEDKGDNKQVSKEAVKEIVKDESKEIPSKDFSSMTEEEKKAKADAAKAKKEARAKAKAEANAKNAVSSDPINPGMIDFRVGYIEKAIKHPDADSLYVSTIQMGDEEGPRTVCSGLVKYIPLEDMQGRYVITIANLKPVTMRGIKSTAMVLCASTEDLVEFVNPPPNSKPGDKIFFENFNKIPEKQLPPKKKIFEQIQPLFSTNDKFEITYTEEGKQPVRLVNEKGELCHNSTIVKADVK